jgi:hypothetical protein
MAETISTLVVALAGFAMELEKAFTLKAGNRSRTGQLVAATRVGKDLIGHRTLAAVLFIQPQTGR